MVSISAIAGGFRTYGSKILKVAPELAFGTSSDSIGKIMRETPGSVFQKAEKGWQELNRAAGENGNFFKKFWKNCKDFLPDIPKAYKAGAKDGGGIWKGIKSVFTHKEIGFGKKMPFIMAALMLVTELPNIFKATTEKGIFQGGKEVLKFGARMTGGGIGAAIGTALIPIPWVGSLVGWTVGDWLTSKIVGKSYTEQQEEKEQILQEMLQPQQQIAQQQDIQQPQTQQQQTNPLSQSGQYNQPAFTGNMTNPFNAYQMQNLPYADDIMMKQMPFNMVA